MDTLLSFAAALISLRLAGRLLAGRRHAWGAGLITFAAAAAAMAWGAAHGWDPAAFRIYYLAGALLSAPLLGIGSLQLAGRRWAGPLGLAYCGLAVGVAAAMPLHGGFGSTAVPHAQSHVDTVPRIVAIAASSLGTLAVVAVAAATLRRRPVGNALLVAAVGVAGAASALTQTAVAAAAACFALAAGLLYASATYRGRPHLPGSARDLGRLEPLSRALRARVR